MIDLPSENGSAPLIHELLLQSRRRRNRRWRRLLAGITAPVRGPVTGRRWRRQPGRAQHRAARLMNRARRARPPSRCDAPAGPPVDGQHRFRTAQEEASATAGEDYEEQEDRLTWGDGDVGDRRSRSSVRKDGGAAEEYEYFGISLSDVEGGAGIGTRNATVGIIARRVARRPARDRRLSAGDLGVRSSPGVGLPELLF